MNGLSEVLLKDLRDDPALQQRVELDEGAVDELAEIAADPDAGPMEPIDVCQDAKALWPYDGRHRIAGWRKAGRKTILARVRPGTLRDAILLSCGANTRHGLKRTADDKRRALRTLLADAEWAAWPDARIARAAGLPGGGGRQMVAEVRAELSCYTGGMRTAERGGVSYPIDVSNLVGPKEAEAFKELPEAVQVKARKAAEERAKREAAAEAEAEERRKCERPLKVISEFEQGPLKEFLEREARRRKCNPERVIRQLVEKAYAGSIHKTKARAAS